MVPISYGVRRTKNTSIAGSVDATLTGNGSKPITDADIFGGMTKKTVNFAAGEDYKVVTWDVIDDSLVEGPEGYKVELSNPLPSGTLSVPSFTGTVLDNDSSGGGSGNLYGPKTATDTGPVEMSSTGATLTTTLKDQVFYFEIGDADGTPIYRLQHAGVNGRLTGRLIAADGTSSQDPNVNYMSVASFAGSAAKLVVTATQIAFYLVDMSTPVFTRGRSDVASGNFIRLRNDGDALPTTVAAS